MADSARKDRPSFAKHPIEFMLRVFGDVHAGEAATVLLLALNVFVLLTAYYFLKVAREPLILLGGGAEVKSYASLGQSILLVFVTNAYSWIAGRVGRIALITYITMFFVLNLLAFWALGTHGVALGVPFFLWVGIFNVVTIAQFWSFAADIYGEEEGKRLFPLVGIGSSIGAVAGAVLAGPIIARHSPFTLMLGAAALLLVGLALTVAVHHREAERGPHAHAAKERIPPGNGFALVLRDRYLLVFALLVWALNFVTKQGDYVLDSMLLAQAPGNAVELGITKTAYIGQFKAHYFQWINTLGVLMQLFVVSRVVKHIGLRAALVLIPLASVAGYGGALVVPLIGVLVIGRVAESSLDYSLSNTAQQSLWLVTSRAAKYKAKQVIDTFFKRAGDTTSAAVVWLGAHYGLGVRGFLTVNIVMALTWVGLALLLGREYANRSAVAPKKAPRAEASTDELAQPVPLSAIRAPARLVK